MRFKADIQYVNRGDFNIGRTCRHCDKTAQDMALRQLSVLDLACDTGNKVKYTHCLIYENGKVCPILCVCVIISVYGVCMHYCVGVCAMHECLLVHINGAVSLLVS